MGMAGQQILSSRKGSVPGEPMGQQVLGGCAAAG